MNINKKTSARKYLEKILGHVTFSELLKTERLGRGLSQVEMAKLLSISKQDLCNIESGRKQVGLVRAIKFAQKLGKSSKVYVQFILQDMVHKAGLKYKIEIEDVA